MKSNLLMNFTVDKANKTINVERAFAAPLAKVWAAWTESELLDQWWAPRPWKTETKTMNFTVGGHWLYAMVGPDGTKHWCRADYQAIAPQQNYVLKDAFCDENGTVNTEHPRSTWNNTFSGQDGQTMVHIKIQYDELSDLEKIIEMGFKEGFTMGMENLDELLAAQ